jgi:hypothetical protein
MAIHPRLYVKDTRFDGVSHIRFTDLFGTNDVDSQTDVGHPRDVHAEKDVGRSFWIQ